MLHNSRSRSSFYSQPKQTFALNKQDTLQLCQSVQTTLEEASKVLPHIQFAPIFEKTMKSLISKAEVQSPNSQSICLQTIKDCLSLYGGSLELNIRALLLEILSELNCNILEEIPSKLNKAKHIVLQTQIEYLLCKIFLLQQSYYLVVIEQTSALRSLKKCIELNQEHMVEYMQEEESIRKEIVDYVIIAYYQYFRIIKQQRPTQALQILFKACNAAKKNYSSSNRIVKGLFQLYRQQEHINNSLEKMSAKSRAITDILDYQHKKNFRTVGFYSWEDQKIVVQLLKVKGKEKQVISEAHYDIKLDINKIRLIKSNEWVTVQKGGQILINEEELLKVLGVHQNQNESHQKQMTTGVQLRNLSKEEIIKKNFLSSSEDDEEFFSKQELNILKFPRAQSSRKFKQTQ